MDMVASNEAAWLDGIGQKLRIGPAEMPKPGEGEIVIRNRAIAVNPISWKVQERGMFVRKWPIIMDFDIAGEVYEVGGGVKGFFKGDRVVAFVMGAMVPGVTRYGAFQLYSVASSVTTAKLPDNLTFAEACVLPTALNTGLIGLFAPLDKGFGLPKPALDLKPPKKHGNPAGRHHIVLWGASSSVGLMVLQLARAAGIEVTAVASPHNFGLCKSSGAREVFDYHDPSVVELVCNAVTKAGGEFVGVFDCISIPEISLPYTTSILERLGGGYLGFLLPELNPEVPQNIKLLHVIGAGEFCFQYWNDNLTSALQEGHLKCLPEAQIVGEGLTSLQEAVNVLGKGVSARKIVVTL